jgi:CubicO group peptidase (beta-lactamase class C family)
MRTEFMTTIAHHTLDARAQATTQQLLDELTQGGLETGLQVAAYLDGQLVVDACSGVADPSSGHPVDAETLFMIFSASKGITATVIHQLAEAGALEYDMPVAYYWPEFAAQGKERVTVRHALCHQAGIPHLPRGLTPAGLCDWDTMVHVEENTRPLWKPGMKTGYHGFTFGVILGELAQRITGRPFTQLVDEQICRPLGIEDLFCGLPETLDQRVATIHGDRPPWHVMPPSLLIKRVIPAAIEPGPIWNDPAIRRAVIPAGNMITSARSLARVYAALCGTGVSGVRLLSPEQVRLASMLRTDAPDQVLFGAGLRKALGYWIGGEQGSAFGARAEVFGHPGAGGSMAFADPEYRFSFALLKNRMTWRGPDDTDVRVARAVRAALGIPN